MHGMPKWIVRTSLLWTLLLFAACTAPNQTVAVSSQTSEEQPVRAEADTSNDPLVLGKTVYDAQCAECHGANGEGQTNWRQPDEEGFLPAPPHDSTGHTWHHADQVLLEIIANGSGMPKTKMIAYDDVLSAAEMEAVLAYIKTFWGKQELEFQEKVTKQYGG